VSKTCKMIQKFDGHYTPGCVDDHGFRLNKRAKPHAFKFCPFCGKAIEVINMLLEEGPYHE